MGHGPSGLSLPWCGSGHPQGVPVMMWVPPWPWPLQNTSSCRERLLPGVHLWPCAPQCPFPRAFPHIPQMFPFVSPSPGSYCMLLNTCEPRCGLPWLQSWCGPVSTGIRAIWGRTRPSPTQGTLQPPLAKTCLFAPNTDAYSSAL